MICMTSTRRMRIPGCLLNFVVIRPVHPDWLAKEATTRQSTCAILQCPSSGSRLDRVALLAALLAESSQDASLPSLAQ